MIQGRCYGPMFHQFIGFNNISLNLLLASGRIQKHLEGESDTKTPLQQKLDEFGHQLSKVCQRCVGFCSDMNASEM